MNSIRPLAFGPVVPTCSTLPYLSLTFSQSNLTVLKRKSFWKSLISNTHTQHTITHAHTQSHTHTNSKKCCKWENSICSSFLGGSVIERCRCFKVLAYHVGSRPHFGSLLEFFLVFPPARRKKGWKTKGCGGHLRSILTHLGPMWVMWATFSPIDAFFLLFRCFVSAERPRWSPVFAPKTSSQRFLWRPGSLRTLEKTTFGYFPPL